MGYLIIPDIWLHLGLSLFVSSAAQVPRGQHASGHRVATVMIDHRRVTVPEDVIQHREQGFLLNATQASLQDVLQAAGFTLVRENDAARDVQSYTLLRPLPGQNQTVICLQKLHDDVAGRPLYWVAQPSPAPSAQATTTCHFAVDEPWTLFTQGLARVSWVELTTEQSVAKNAIMMVDLRHAAGALQQLWSADADASGHTCSGPSSSEASALTPQQVADSVVWHSATSGKRLALTFDACSTYNYGPFNPNVIRALQELEVPATLFVGGHWAEMHPDILRSLARDPLFEIGNHTYSHPHMRDLEPEQQAQELRWTQALIYNLTGVVPRMFRPPYGEVDDAMLTEVARAGLTTVEYDLPAGDADVHVSPLKLTQWVVSKAQAGSIVIMHMNRPKNHTAEALPMIVKQLRAQGYVFCQMSDLMDDGGERCR